VQILSYPLSLRERVWVRGNYGRLTLLKTHCGAGFQACTLVAQPPPAVFRLMWRSRFRL